MNGSDDQRREQAEAIRERLAAGDPEALAMIYDAYAHGLYGFLTSRLGREGEAQDVLQRVFLKIARDPKRLLRARRLEDYLFIMTRNESVSWQRERARQAGEAPADWDRLLVAAVADDPELPEAMVRRLSAALGELPPEQREVIHLKIHGNKTFRDIADLLGISLNTAASRYRYALDKLRERLGEDFRETEA